MNDLDDLLDDLSSGRHVAKQRALDQFKAAFGPDADLASACLGLRMACNGAADPLRLGELEQRAAALKARLATWDPPHGTRCARLDAAFREMVEATLVEIAPYSEPSGA